MIITVQDLIDSLVAINKPDHTIQIRMAHYNPGVRLNKAREDRLEDVSSVGFNHTTVFIEGTSV